MRLFSDLETTEIPKDLQDQWDSLFYNEVQDLKGIREVFLSLYPPFREWISKTPHLGANNKWLVNIDYQDFPFSSEDRRKFRDAHIENDITETLKIIRDIVDKHDCATRTVRFQDISYQSAIRPTEIRDLVDLDKTDIEKERFQNITIDTWMTWTEAQKRLKPFFKDGNLEKRDGRRAGSIIIDPHKDLDIYLRWLCKQDDTTIAIDVYGPKNYETDRKNVYSKIKKFRKLIDPNNQSSGWNP